MASDLQRVKVDVGEQGVRADFNLLQKLNQLLKRLQLHDFWLETDKDSNGEVEDEVLVSLEKKDLPELIEQAKVDNASVQSCH